MALLKIYYLKIPYKKIKKPTVFNILTIKQLHMEKKTYLKCVCYSV